LFKILFFAVNLFLNNLNFIFLILRCIELELKIGQFLFVTKEDVEFFIYNNAF